MTVTPEMRKQYFGQLPRVTYVPDNQTRCEAYRWGHMPLWALFRDVLPNKTDEERRERLAQQRCKKRAVFRFKKLKRSQFARSGLYCWTHMSNQVTNDPLEAKTSRRWTEAHPPEWANKSERQVSA